MDFRTRCARGVGIVEDVGRPLAPPIVTASTFAFLSQEEVESYYASGARMAVLAVRESHRAGGGAAARGSLGVPERGYLFELPSFSGSKVPPPFVTGGPARPGLVAPSGSVPSGLS